MNPQARLLTVSLLMSFGLAAPFSRAAQQSPSVTIEERAPRTGEIRQTRTSLDYESDMVFKTSGKADVHQSLKFNSEQELRLAIRADQDSAGHALLLDVLEQSTQLIRNDGEPEVVPSYLQGDQFLLRSRSGRWELSDGEQRAVDDATRKLVCGLLTRDAEGFFGIDDWMAKSCRGKPLRPGDSIKLNDRQLALAVDSVAEVSFKELILTLTEIQSGEGSEMAVFEVSGAFELPVRSTAGKIELELTDSTVSGQLLIDVKSGWIQSLKIQVRNSIEGQVSAERPVHWSSTFSYALTSSYGAGSK